jgi:phosphonate transport system ATP-binding protein
MLTLERLVKRYGPITALDQVSLEVPSGQFVGILGRSGAGKSTLLRLVNRLVEPTAGRLLADAVDVTALRGRRLHLWRARCGMIFQQFNLVARLDVLTNVLIGRLSYHGPLTTVLGRFTAEERALAVQALVRLDVVASALQRADTLSGGQQQRVAIARALVQQPSVLLADEPIASLDPRNARRVMEALRRINREDGLTVLCNLHALEAARAYSDRIVGMAGGRVVFDGPATALTPAAVRAIYGSDEATDDRDDGEVFGALPGRAREPSVWMHAAATSLDEASRHDHAAGCGT